MSKRFKKLSHSLYECKYHVVFCPKYRFRIFDGEISRYTGELIYRLVGQKEQVEVLELNVQPDHIHLLLEIPPKYSVSNVLGFLKGKLATRLFEQYPHLGRKYWGRHLWSRGYCVSTVGIEEEKIRQYVRWQEQQERELEQVQKATQVRLFEK